MARKRFAEPIRRISDCGAAACFCRGTMILTPAGEVPVESLKVGDPVTTLSGETRPIVWVGSGRRAITAADPHLRPVMLRAGALADGVPSRDLSLTGRHALYLDGLLIPAEYLVNERSVLRDETAGVVELHHLALPSHDVLVANGAPAESYHQGHDGGLFQQADPPGPAVAGERFAPLAGNGPALTEIWRRLLERSGFTPPALTSDPDLHLLADGLRIDPSVMQGQTYTFRLDRIPALLLIVSRRVRPVEIGHNHDGRRLGIALRSITLSDDGMTMELGADLPWLTDGFHPPEGDFRWTNGEAAVPGRALLAFEGPIALTLEVAHTPPYERVTK